MPDLHGRQVIYTDVDEVSSDNVVDVLKKAVDNNTQNVTDIEYLYDYYKGDQPILDREKTFNDTILNTIVENRANEIVSFKTGYFLSAPIQYIDAGEDEVTADLKTLNAWLRLESKSESDLQLAEWFSICGTAYRLILPKEERLTDTDSPFEFFTLDPRTTFVVYSSRLGHKPIMGVTYVTSAESKEKVTYYVYTANEFFVIFDNEIVSRESHTLGAVPIIEYPANNSRMGDFEVVIGLLDCINGVQSDRADAVEGFIQSILCLENMQIDTDSEAGFMQHLKEVGGLFVPEGGKAYYLSQQLNQGDTQTFKNDLYEAVLTICGMPNRNGGSSTSDTGAAVLLRDGWSAAEARAKNTEICFEKSERKFLNMVIFYANTMGGTNLELSQVDIRFPRRNYTNDSAKVSNLVTMLSNDWIAPQQAFEHSDMFPDPDAAFMEAKKWHDEQEKKNAASLAKIYDVDADAGTDTDTETDTEEADE